ncbi:MAG: DEAD/DEAH box helicase [Anaerolineae bacterium]|nr:DEAD/DEAH box helicase [Anaerolineae bacterium]
MTNDFADLNLRPELVQAVAELGYTQPTPVQSRLIPLMLSGRDVIAQSQTGTGKTAAFGLPILNTLIPGQRQVQALVVTPTRELAMQVSEAFLGYSSQSGARVMAVYGGQPYGRPKQRLKSGVDILVGTPGRLLDLIRQKVLDLSAVRTVVLDEADEMLSMGFIEDIETILAETPGKRQTALFSATLPKAIRKLADQYMDAPESITIEQNQMTVEAIEQRYYLVNQKDKLAALTRIFEFEEITSALIFTRTRATSSELANKLTVRGFPAEALNGDLTQDARIRVLSRFRENQMNVLVATDVAARGLDIDDISHVFNFDLPTDSEAFVHRVGRTGRAGKSGIAISLVTPSERGRLKQIETYTNQKLQRAMLPTEKDILEYRESQLITKMKMWLDRDRAKREQEIVEELITSGYDPVKIAAAAMKMARSQEKQRPIAQISEVTMSSRKGPKDGYRKNGSPSKGGGRKKDYGSGSDSHESGMVRLSLGRGKKHGVRPNDIVGMIASNAQIPGYTIGKIVIRDQHTLVDIPEEYVETVLSKTGNYNFRDQRNIDLKRAN